MQVTRSDRDGIATLTLDRPDKLNSLTVAMFEDLLGHVQDIARQIDTVGVVVVKGAGRSFCAGNDISAIADGPAPSRPDLQAHVITQLAGLPQPVVAAVHGYCFTGGLELALAADIILAASDAQFADTHAQWSLTPMWGMTQRLPRRIGRAKASEMMFTGRRYGADAAVAMGLANLSIPADRFDAEVARFVEDIAGKAWFSHRSNKRTLRETQDMELAEGLAYEIATHPGVIPDAQARLAGFSRQG